MRPIWKAIGPGLACLTFTITLAPVLSRADETVASGPAADPVTARRLNRAEYNNSIRDLVGADLRLGADLPPDDSGYGFDNMAEVLTLSPILMERYLASAERVAMNPDIRDRIVACIGKELRAACARRVIATFAHNAFRRPVLPAEVDRLMQFQAMAARDGQQFEDSVMLAVKAILVSPRFLFRVEENRPGAISDVELATRLSYLLWSSTPDEELLRLAESGQLRGTTPSGESILEQQVQRMLKSWKAGALASNFGGQWLQFRNLDRVFPDPRLFPDFDWRLRQAMPRETLLFFQSIVAEDRSIFDFIDAKYTFVNERLARHYGMEGVKGNEFRRVELDGTQRAGVLTQAGILAITSLSTRTSPVLRGKYILETIFNAPPPPPPPDVPSLPEAKGEKPASVRQQLEQHRSNAVCASCHSRMDPLGFGLENYDAVGAWRTAEGTGDDQIPVDASGTLPAGMGSAQPRAFNGPAELRQLLRSQPDLFRKALATKLLTYALGRGPEPADRIAIDSIIDRLASQDDRFSQLVVGVVESVPFQSHRLALLPPPSASLTGSPKGARP